MKIRTVLRGAVSFSVLWILVILILSFWVSDLSSLKVNFADAAAPQPGLSIKFEVPELKFAMTLPTELSDLNYSVDSTSVPGTSFAYFSTASLQNMNDAKTTKCNSAQGAIGAIWRVSVNPQMINGIAMSAFKQLSGGYLVYESPQSLCSSNIVAQKLQEKQINLMKQALGTAVEIQ